DLKDSRLEAARGVFCRATLVRRRLGPDADFLVAALHDAPSLELGDVRAPRAVVQSGDADLAAVRRLEHHGVVANRVGRFDSVERGKLVPVEGRRADGGFDTKSRCVHRNSLLSCWAPSSP